MSLSPDPTTHPVVDRLESAGLVRGGLLSVTIADSLVGLAVAGHRLTWAFDGDQHLVQIVSAIEAALRPRWVWWSGETPTRLTAVGIRVAMCWDLAAVHRLLFGGWHAEEGRIWASLHGISVSSLPTMGQLGLLDQHAEEGTDPDDPVRPDGHLRPEWTGGAWTADEARVGRWAALALDACVRQRAALAALPHCSGEATARSESAAQLLCTELEADGLPIDVGAAGAIIAASIGPRPLSDGDAAAARSERDALVLRHARSSVGMDLRNPAHVRSMLQAIGIDVANTRAHRLEPFRGTHPFVDALLTWRKAERIATTYGHAWLDHHVGPDGRLRGAWTSCDGAAGRMTAQAGLHNLPAEMRRAVVAEPGHAFVHADLGQIEPRVLAAVSGDAALAAATASDDLYAPVAQRLGVERPVAKVAVLAAMYGQTSGAAGEALRGMEAAYPVAMQFLREADRAGQSGRDVRTHGGRLVRMWGGGDDRAAAGARGRFARNAVIQGAAAELFKAWAVTVRSGATPLGGSIVLCLHDELLVHVPAEAAVEMARLLESALPRAAARWMPGSPVRYVASASVVTSWADAK